MLFNFVLGGTVAARLATLDDALRPLFFGLRAAGHRVVAIGQRFEARPAVNLVVADTAADGGGKIAAQARRDAGKAACIGLLFVDDVDTAASHPQRWAELQRLIRTADFVWTCAPTAAFAGLVAVERQAVVQFGFDPALLGPRLERDPMRRDAGIVLYGEDGARPAELAGRLTQAGGSALFARAGHFPDYIISDLLGRAVLAVVTRHQLTDGSPPAMRIAKALCNGATVIAEASAPGQLSLAPYVTECAYDDIPRRCLALLRENPVQRGLDALERFKGETSMAAGLAGPIEVAALSCAAPGGG